TVAQPLARASGGIDTVRGGLAHTPAPRRLLALRLAGRELRRHLLSCLRGRGLGRSLPAGGSGASGTARVPPQRPDRSVVASVSRRREPGPGDRLSPRVRPLVGSLAQR